MKQISMLALVTALGLSPLAAIAQSSEAAPDHGPLPAFAVLDADASGSVSLDEVEAALLARFTAADSDASGMLDADELAATMEAMMQARVDMASEEHAERAANMAERMASRLPKMAERMIERMDRDADGMLSAAEMRLPNLAEMFARIDSDDDGVVSEWEYDQMRAHMGERAGRGGPDGEGRGNERGEGRGGDRGDHHRGDRGQGGGHGGGWFNWGRGN